MPTPRKRTGEENERRRLRNEMVNKAAADQAKYEADAYDAAARETEDHHAPIRDLMRLFGRNND